MSWHLSQHPRVAVFDGETLGARGLGFEQLLIARLIYLDRCAIFASISWNSRKTRGFKTPRSVTDLNFVQVLQVLCQTGSMMHRIKNQVNTESIPNQNDKWELCCYWNSMKLPVLEHVSNSMSNVQPKFRHSCLESVCLLRATVLLETCTQYERWGFSRRWFQPIWMILVELDHFPGASRGNKQQMFETTT